MSYAHPEVLVTTEWVDEHKGDANVRLVEVDVDTSSFELGHVPNAVGWNWTSQLCDTIRRDIIPRDQLQKLLGEAGISNDTKVVLYGDNNNWFAAWALWQLKVYGHKDVCLMDGGRKKWVAEGRVLTTDASDHSSVRYEASGPNWDLRAYLPEVFKAIASGDHHYVDVRSPAEFSGEILAPPGLPETCQRGGHIPGASNIPWAKACNDDGTFRSRDDLARIYADAGVDGTKPIIAYCRIGERSSHSWFALHYLLGYDNVRNYDGSWTEYGNLVGVDIEKP